MNFSNLFWTVAGLIAMGMGIFMPTLNRVMGNLPRDEQFTVLITIIDYALLGLAFLSILLMIIITMTNWHA